MAERGLGGGVYPLVMRGRMDGMGRFGGRGGEGECSSGMEGRVYACPFLIFAEERVDIVVLCWGLEMMG